MRTLGYDIKGEQIPIEEPEDEEEEKEAELRKIVEGKQIELKEFLLGSDIEQSHISKMYFKQTAILHGTQRITQVVEESESDDEDAIDNMYIKTNFGLGPSDDKHA